MGIRDRGKRMPHTFECRCHDISTLLWGSDPKGFLCQHSSSNLKLCHRDKKWRLESTVLSACCHYGEANTAILKSLESGVNSRTIASKSNTHTGNLQQTGVYIYLFITLFVMRRDTYKWKNVILGKEK
jgi:hypothetical protein